MVVCLIGLQISLRADDRCSHSIRIKIISRNEFFIKKGQCFSKSTYIEKHNSDNITLKWHLSSRRKKISVSSDSENEFLQVKIRKNKYTNIITKDKEILNLYNNNDGECIVDYKFLEEAYNKKKRKVDITYTVTDKY